MPMTRASEDFVSFMVLYTDFLSQMRADEKSKLEALSSRELPRIERCIATSQANAKQLENYEAKRAAIQAEAGYEGMTFRQVIESAPAAEQKQLWQLFSEFEGNVAEIRFYNDKSMAVARDNMMEIDPASVLVGQGGVKPNNPYEKIREEQSGMSTIMEKKA